MHERIIITLICAITLISVAFAQASDDVKTSLSIVSPEDDQILNISTILVSGRASNNHGLDKVEVKVGTGAWQMAAGTSTWRSSVTLSPGKNTIYARAISAHDSDISGKISRKSQKTSITITLDTELPAITISSPKDGEILNISTILVSGTASDNIGLDKVEVKVGTGAWQMAAGMSTWSSSVTLSPGKNTIYARATDTAGNYQDTQVTVILENELPAITISSPKDGEILNISTILVSGTASDNIGLDKVEVKVGTGAWQMSTGMSTWSSSVTLSPGKNTIYARATDSAGNYQDTQVTVILENEFPAITISSPKDGEILNISTILVSGTASDNIGLDKVEVKVGTGAWQMAAGMSTWSSSVTLSPGKNTIYARATDTAGNYQDTQVTVILENEFPAITISSPKDGEILNISTILVSGTASDNIGLDKVEVKVGTGAWQMAAGMSTWSSSVTLSPGKNTIYARATDTAGNYQDTQVTVILENEFPAITISSPKDGEILNISTILVSGTASDNIGLDKVEVKVGTGAWQMSTGMSTWSSSVTLSPGKNTIYARATDTAGNYQDTQVTVILENELSAITIPVPTQSKVQSSSSSGGGGGGGGGGTSGEDFTNILVKERYDLYIYKDIVTSYKFIDLSNPIMSINIVGNVNAGEIGTAVEVLKNRSSLVKSQAPGNVYKNVNMWVGTSGFGTSKNIKEAVIKFKVEKSWISSNNMKSSGITMVRWDGSKWNELETSEKTRDSTYLYFEAKSNSFSSFAITEIEKKESINENENVEIIEFSKQAATIQPEEKKSDFLTNWFLIIGVFFAIGLIIEMYLRMKKK